MFILDLSGERNLKIEVVSNTSVKLIWSSVSNDIPCGSTAAMYKIEWRRIDQSSVNLEYTTTLTKVISGEFKVLVSVVPCLLLL